MAKKKLLISPKVNTYETDLTDNYSAQQGATSIISKTTYSSSGVSNVSVNNNTSFILCEDFNNLLQEDGNKLKQ
jgi:hypothetical protein